MTFKRPFQLKLFYDSHVPNPVILKMGKGRSNKNYELVSELNSIFCSAQSRVAHIPRRCSQAICSRERHLLPLLHSLSPQNYWWTNLWNISQNASLQLDHSLEKFSIQSQCQKTSGYLNRSRLPVVTSRGLFGFFGSLFGLLNSSQLC